MDMEGTSDEKGVNFVGFVFLNDLNLYCCMLLPPRGEPSKLGDFQVASVECIELLAAATGLSHPGLGCVTPGGHPI